MLAGIYAWFWVLTILGYRRRYLNRNNMLLAYAKQAMYLFDILRQTVIVVIAYSVETPSPAFSSA